MWDEILSTGGINSDIVKPGNYYQGKVCKLCKDKVEKEAEEAAAASNSPEWLELMRLAQECNERERRRRKIRKMTTTLEERRNRYEWIYKETAEMSAILGIKTPKIKIVGIDADAREEIGGYYYKDGDGGKHRHYYAGTASINEHKIIIKPKRSPFASIRVGSTRTTIAHELIHLKYWKLRHGKEFDKRTKELVEKWKQKKKKKSRETR